MALLYQLTVRAYLAVVLDRIDIDGFIEKAPEAMTLTALAALIYTEF